VVVKNSSSRIFNKVRLSNPYGEKYSNVLKPWVMSSRAERLRENVTRQIWTG